MRELNQAITVMLLMAVMAYSSLSSAAEPRTGEQVHSLTFSTAAGRASSANYGATVTVGQVSSGECSSSNFGVNQGFWLIISGGGGGGGCCDTPGDASDDGVVNVGDAVYLVTYIFKGGPAPPCMAEGDANCDLTVNVGDAVYVINYVFKGGPAPCCP